MGHSITEATHQKIEKNRREGRLCGGATRSRSGCTTRATFVKTSEVWTYKIGEGEPQVLDMPVCKRHAAQTPVGYAGVNFRVTAVVAR